MAKYKLLMVDDDKNYVEALLYVLNLNNYDVAVAYSKDEGLARLKETNPDLIILDVMMGKRADGMLFARKVRRSKEYAAYAGVPILVLTSIREQTGFFFPGEAKNPVFFPIDELLEKPVKPVQLLEKIAQLLERREAGAGPA